MTTMNVFIVQFILLFILAICIIELYLYVRRGRSLNRHEIKAKINKFSVTASSTENPDILRNRKLSNVEFLNKILVSIPIFGRFRPSHTAGKPQLSPWIFHPAFPLAYG